MTTKSVYEIITEKITQILKKDVVPWGKPRTNSNAFNWKHKSLIDFSFSQKIPFIITVQHLSSNGLL